MRPLGIVEADELGEDRSQVPFVDDDEAIQAFTEAAYGERLPMRVMRWPLSAYSSTGCAVTFSTASIIGTSMNTPRPVRSRNRSASA